MWFGPGCKNKTLSLSGFGSICPIFSFSSRAPPSSLSSLRQQQVLSRSYWLRQLPLHSLFWQPLFTHSPHPTPSLFALYNNKPTERPAAVVLFSFFFSSFFSFHTKIIIIIIWMKLSRVSLDCSLLSSPLPSHGVECVFCSTLLSPTFPRHLSHPPTPHHHHQHHHHSRHCCIDDWISTAQQRNSSSSSSSRFSKSN